jgi:Flp pilus assembly protein TadB
MSWWDLVVAWFVTQVAFPVAVIAAILLIAFVVIYVETHRAQRRKR